ncbi:MAG: ABC transporter substrate-binding protein [Deltaproteobacteria bacterium]|nr:ABC transporter substrate-binding protein [Deltaproteobacteria bacterium]
MKYVGNVLAVLIFSLLLMGLTQGHATDRPVRMAYLQNDIHHLALWVALEKNFFREEGVSVEVAGIFRAGPEIMTAFAAGALDMAYVGEAPATTAVANKAADVVAVAQVNTEGSALVVAKDASGIVSVADLEGKTVAVPGHSTVQDFLLRKAIGEAMADQQADLSKVNIIVVKPPEMIGALRTGQIDAFVAWEPYPSKANTLGVGRNLATSHDIWAGHPCCVLVSSSVFLEKASNRVLGVLRAHVKATEYIGAYPEEALQIGVKYTGMDAKTVETAMKNVHYTYELNVEGEKEYVEFLSELKYIKVPDAGAFTERFLRPDMLKSLQSR